MWGGKVITGWHFVDPQPWDKVEGLFGTHEAKYQLKGWVEHNGIARIERFTQSIGEEPYSEIELAVPGADVGGEVDALSAAFAQLTGAPLPGALIERFRASAIPAFGLACRIRSGKITRLAAIAPGASFADAAAIATAAGAEVAPKLEKLVGAIGQGIARVEYGRAGERAGVDVYLIPRKVRRARPRRPRRRRPMPRIDYLLASDDQLIAQCEVDRYRASGPGGQHRNKTDSAVRLRHKLSGVTAIGEDSRSQSENKHHAVRRLRSAIALEVREPVQLDRVPSPRLAAFVAAGTAPLGAKTKLTGAYWAAIAELLDVLVAGELEIAATAQRLGITTGAMSKLLLHDDQVARVVNDLRRARGMRALR